MRNIVIISTALVLTACSNIPEQREQQKQLVKTVAIAAVVLAVAGSVGASQHASKCKNNTAGFYQDHSTGKIYNC